MNNKLISTSYKILSRTLLSFVVLAVVLALLLVAALSRGPLSLTFMGPYLDQIIAEQYPEMNFAFDDIEMLWDGRDKNMVFNVKNMSIRKEIETVAYIPAVTVTFSGDALLKGRLAPSGLRFTGLKIVLTRTEDGAMRLGYSYGGYQDGAQSDDKAAEAANPEVIHALLAALGQKKATSDLTAYLERLEIYQFGLFVEDEKIEKRWQISAADLILWKNEEGLNGRLQGDAHFGEDTINLIFDAAYNRNTGETVMQTSVRDLPLPLLAREIPELEILKGVTLPVSGNIDLSIDRNFLPKQVSFELKASAGQVDIPSLYKKPLTLNSIEIEGHSAAPFNGVNLNVIKIDSPGPKITMSGRFQKTDAGFGMSIEGSFPEIEAREAALYWPYSTAVDAYNWVTKNIRDGRAKNVTFRVDLPVGAISSGNIPDDAIELKFDVEGASVDYFSPLPKVTNIYGKTVLTEKQVHVFDLVGEMNGLKLPQGDVLIYDFDKYDQIADITLKVGGESSTIFEFLDLKPLGFATPYGINPARMTGEGLVTAQFIFPLRNDLQIEQVVFEASGEFRDAFIPAVYEKYDLSNGNMAALVTPEKLTVKGTGNIQGTDADISFQSWFKGKKAGQRRYEVLAKLDNADRKRLALLDTEYLNGPVGASLAVDLFPDGVSSGLATLNLLESELTFEPLKIVKPVGVNGLAGTQFRTDKDGNIKLSNIRLDAENLKLVAEATLDKDGLLSLIAENFKFENGNASLNVKRTALNAYDARINGSHIDLRPFISEKTKAPTEDPSAVREALAGPSVKVNFAFNEAIMDEGVRLSNLQGAVEYGQGIIQRGDINASFAQKHTLRYTVTPDGADKRKMEFTTSEAGILLKALDIYDDGVGGALNVSGSMTNHPLNMEIKGQIKIENMKVYKASVLGKILTIGSLTGIVELLQNDGMTFASIEGPFTYKDGAIETKDFRAVGAIGLTFTGKIDQVAQTTEGFGTVIPAYTLNSILGNIPILGTLLVGREGEGIFGFSYKLSGKSEDPDVFVNPVSALAPGILRRMFFEPWTDVDTKPSTPDTKKGPSAAQP